MQFFQQWTFTQYLVEHFDAVWPRFVEHLTLSVTALLFATAIALPLGLFIHRVRTLRGPVMITLNMIYTIPSLALFVLLVPIMGIGSQPAIFALTLYALFILVRNTVTGLDGVDPAVKEAATGMGMSKWRILRRVEIPLALPVIVAGMRIATLSTIGLAAIASWIGAGGLGNLLRDSLFNLDLPINQSRLYAGLICIALIAIGFDLFYRLIERIVGVPTAPRPQSAPKAAAQPKEA